MREIFNVLNLCTIKISDFLCLIFSYLWKLMKSLWKMISVLLKNILCYDMVLNMYSKKSQKPIWFMVLRIFLPLSWMFLCVLQSRESKIVILTLSLIYHIIFSWTEKLLNAISDFICLYTLQCKECNINYTLFCLTKKKMKNK